MKQIVFTIVMALGVLALCLCMAYAIMDTQQQHGAQLRNAYFPFSVETSIYDK